MLARLFHASKTGVGMTVSAATLGVAISAPIFGALTERLPRKRVIVAVAAGYLGAHVAGGYFHFAGPADLLAVSAGCDGSRRDCCARDLYRRGVAAGTSGADHEFLCQRHGAGRVYRAHLGGRSGGVVQLARRVLLRWARRRWPALGGWPRGCRKDSAGQLRRRTLEARLPFPYQVQELFRSRRLVATFAVGFNVLFSLVGVFTWITFHLSAAPFNLSTDGAQLAVFCVSGRTGGHSGGGLPDYAGGIARWHWGSDCLFDCGRPADARAGASDRDSRAGHGFKRRVCGADGLDRAICAWRRRRGRA